MADARDSNSRTFGCVGSTPTSGMHSKGKQPGHFLGLYFIYQLTDKIKTARMHNTRSRLAWIAAGG